MTFESWLVFVAVWIAAGLPLGPNAANCIALSAAQGFGRSLWAVAGILLAALCHKAAVILGVAAILYTHPGVLTAVKLAGAAYLIWMGYTLWRKGGDMAVMAGAASGLRLRAMRRAFWISMSNPKAMLAYLAVFSQFLTEGDALAPQLAVLVPTALAITAAIYVGYCAVGAGLARFLGTYRRRLVFNRSVGVFYALIGTGLAMSSIGLQSERPSAIQ